MTLGEKIYKLRNDRNMTQEQLAEKLGVTRQSVSKWEGDLVKPEIDKLKAMAKLFEISLDELISDEAGEKTSPETDSLKRQIKIYRLITIITATICIITLVVMIVVSVNLSKRIKAVEQRGSTVIYQDPGFDDGSEEVFSGSSWEIKNADIKAQTAELYVEAEPERYSDSTQITAMAETDSGKQYTGQLQNSNGKFKGKVIIPIIGDKMKISVVVDNDGEKQKITLDENVYMLDKITALPTINITTGKTRGITYTGTIGVWVSCEDMTLTENIQDIKVIIKNKDKIVFKSAAAKSTELDPAEYSFKCEEADWEKDFTAGISYYDGNIDKTVKIYGTFDPTNFYDDEQGFIISADSGSYDDNYHIVIK